MNRKKNEFNFTFDGQLESIEVHSLTSSLLALNELLKDINYELGTNKIVELTVKTYKPGSFDVYLQLVADVLAVGSTIGLFSGNNLEAARNVIEATLSALNLKKFLAGEKPRQVIKTKNNTYKITNNKGEIIIIEGDVYGAIKDNKKIDKHATEIFKSIENKQEIKGISMRLPDSNKYFSVSKDDESFDYMLLDSPIIEELEQKRDKHIDEAVLSVYSLTFGDSKRWEFYYEGNKIPAKMCDDIFMGKVINRVYHFANGDRILCQMVIHQTWNDIAKVFENKAYSIIKVKGAPIPPDRQTNLFNNDQEETE